MYIIWFRYYSFFSDNQTQHGQVKFVTPAVGRDLSQEEMHKLGEEILRRLDLEGYSGNRLAEGTIMIRRLRRALGGSGLKAGMTHDLQPVDIWKKLADVSNFIHNY